MNEEIRDDNRPSFIPCGDALEKMDQLNDEELEDVSGGTQIDTANITLIGW